MTSRSSSCLGMTFIDTINPPCFPPFPPARVSLPPNPPNLVAFQWHFSLHYPLPSAINLDRFAAKKNRGKRGFPDISWPRPANQSTPSKLFSKKRERETGRVSAPSVSPRVCVLQAASCQQISPCQSDSLSLLRPPSTCAPPRELSSSSIKTARTIKLNDVRRLLT